MAILLCIDSSTTHASVALAKDGELLCIKTNQQQKDHASFLQPGIQEITEETGISLLAIDAVAVTAGPGSYTGLRVAMASAKGLCYALQKPLITLSTTEVMAAAAALQLTENNHENGLLCPLIDARRMEVFTAIYTTSLKEVMPKQAMLLHNDSFAELLQQHSIYFFGDGADKWKAICKNSQAHFLNVHWNAANMIPAASQLFDAKVFTPLIYAAPDYVKEVHFINK